MRYIINQISDGEDELILNYRHLNPEVEAVLAFMEKKPQKLLGKIQGETIVFSPEDILYVEKVDDKTFAYTVDHVIQLDMSLYSVELFLDDKRYFRCSKSMIVNVQKVVLVVLLVDQEIIRQMNIVHHVFQDIHYKMENVQFVKMVIIQVVVTQFVMHVQQILGHIMVKKNV